MKTLLILLLLIPTLSWGCINNLKDYFNSDDMIQLVVYSDNKMDLYINNIRNFKAINIKDYGFTNKMRKQFEDDYGCPKTSFIEAFSSSGMPKIVNGKAVSKYSTKILMK